MDNDDIYDVINEMPIFLYISVQRTKYWSLKAIA